MPFLLILIGSLVLRYAEVESVTFDKECNKLILAKTKVLFCNRNQCEISLRSITDVAAVRRGINKANMDMTFYTLILTLVSG